jgi:hypothetical protein
MLGDWKSKSKSWTNGARADDRSGNQMLQQQQQQGTSVRGNAVQHLTAVCQLMSQRQAYSAAALLAAGNTFMQPKGSKQTKTARFANDTSMTMTPSVAADSVNVTDISLRYNKPTEAGFGRYRRKSLVGRLVTELGGRGHEASPRYSGHQADVDESSLAVIPPSQPTKRRRAVLLHPPSLFTQQRGRRNKRRMHRGDGDWNHFTKALTTVPEATDIEVANKNDDNSLSRAVSEGHLHRVTGEANDGVEGR